MKRSNLTLGSVGTAVVALGSAAHADTLDVWQLLDEIAIEEIVTETTYEVRKSYPAALTEGREVEVEITGYATPSLPGETIRELLLVSDMGLCPFCGSLDHGATLVVSLNDAIPTIEDSTRLTLKGTLAPVDDPETWQSVVLKNAQIVAH
jgi:hypothetical protein